MWNRVESTIQPKEVDETSSCTIVYVRKNIVFVEATEEKEAHWEWDETTVPKENWELYKKVINNTSDISDVNDALVELANIIGA